MKNEAQTILIRDYQYDLPPEKIAEFPLQERDASRLLVYRDGKIEDKYFTDLAGELPIDSLMLLNNTRVIEARILFQKASGGQIEIFCLEPWRSSMETSLTSRGPVQWSCLIGGASKWKHGLVLEKKLQIEGEDVLLQARYVEKKEDSFIVEFSWSPNHFSFSEILHQAGNMPLPPYIKRKLTEEDKERYQTIFSREEGSVAAPTAALHFTKRIFSDLSEKNIRVDYVTLHVGAGTFKPVKTETIAEHQMHQEAFSVSKNTLQNILDSIEIIAVGTTTLRTMESLHWIGLKLMNETEDPWNLNQWEAYDLAKKFPSVSPKDSIRYLIKWMEKENQENIHCHTSLIILPGYHFQFPSALVTNFHQPQSTLLLLVAAFIGEDWKKVYRHALDNNYRFLSYGDSSLLWKRRP